MMLSFVNTLADVNKNIIIWEMIADDNIKNDRWACKCNWNCLIDV